jgi:hypothetical protein
MANLHRRRIFSGTTATRGVTDPRDTMFRELLHFDNVTPGVVEKAIDKALTVLPTVRTISGSNCSLIDVSGRLMSCDTAMVTARYGNKASNGGTNKEQNIDMDLGFASVQWVQTALPYVEPPRTAGKTYEQWVLAYQALIDAAVAATDGGEGSFDDNGMPSGAANTNGAGRIAPYAYQVPVWTIRVRAVLNSHPGPRIKVYSTRRVNKVPITWAGFRFEARTLRFDGVKTRQYGNKWNCMYSFSYKGGGWHEQRLIGATWKPTDSDGEPEKDSSGNAIETRSAAFGTTPMYKSLSFESPGFPDK